MNDTTKFLKGINQDFESSCGLTEQFKFFFSESKKIFKKELNDHILDFSMNRGHFYFCGFIKSNKNQWFYFSVSDVRDFKEELLIRTAKDFCDYTGGHNCYIKINEKLFENIIEFISK